MASAGIQGLSEEQVKCFEQLFETLINEALDARFGPAPPSASAPPPMALPPAASPPAAPSAAVHLHLASRPVVTSPPRSWLRSALKPALIARLAACDTPLPPRWPPPMASSWLAPGPLYVGLVKQGFG